MEEDNLRFRALLSELPDSDICAGLERWLRCGTSDRRHAILKVLQDNPESAFQRLMAGHKKVHGGENTFGSRASTLQQLPASILGALWPPERVITGMMASKWLRKQIVDHAAIATLQNSHCVALPSHIGGSDYLRQFGTMRVWVRWEDDEIQSDWGAFSKAVEAASLRLESLALNNNGAHENTVPGCHSSLTFLSLRACSVHFNHLDQCTALSHLAVSDCRLDCNAIPKISQIVQRNPGLRHLDLSMNSFGIWSMVDRTSRLAELRHCVSLTHLDFSQGNFDDTAVATLSDIVGALTNLCRLNLSGNSLLDDSKPGFQMLMTQISTLSSLTSLDMSDCDLGPRACDFLHLILDHCRMQELGWSGNPMTRLILDDLITFFCTRRNGPTALRLNSCDLASDVVAGGLSPSLTHLDLGGNTFTPAAAQQIRERVTALTLLRHLNLKGVPLERTEGRGLVQGCSGLTSLNLSGSGAGCMLAEDIGRALENSNGVVQELKMAKNGMDSRAARRMLRREAGGRGVTVLDLGQNMLGAGGCGTVGRWLQGSRDVTKLNLSHNQIGGDGGRILSGLMGQWGKLTVLELGENGIGADGVRGIARALLGANCWRLVHLGLSGNAMGDEGAREVAEVVRATPRLEHLDLVQNEIGDDGGGALCDALAAREEQGWVRVPLWVDVQGNELSDCVPRFCGLEVTLFAVLGCNLVAGLPGFDCRVNMRTRAKNVSMTRALRFKFAA